MALALISRKTLPYYKIDCVLDAAWTLSAINHEKGAGDGVGTFLKSTARRETLSKAVYFSSARVFYDFLVKDQFETANAAGRTDPTGIHLVLGGY